MSGSNDPVDAQVNEPRLLDQFGSQVGLGRIALGAAFLGVMFGSHVVLAVLALTGTLETPGLLQWTLYILAMAFFHFSEFIVTARYNPGSLSYESFLLNHSREYKIAVALAWLEFWLEWMFVPSVKSSSVVLLTAVCIVLVGQYFRCAAMWTAKSNFSHLIADERRAGHQLVRHGVYRFFRHPSYFGWFWWAFGTQVLLANPVCSLLYLLASWSFFKARIPYEEVRLLSFFGEEYRDYIHSTWIGIPGVNGYLDVQAKRPHQQ